jgi:pimeloyl-ACP methyl ester carboxylesterase
MAQGPTHEIERDAGRTLACAEYGDPAGSPVFYQHGFPGSRLEWPLIDPDDRAAAAGVRILAPDRPGMGRSTPQPGRAIADWPVELAAIADALDIERYAVLGVSGGGPYAAVCAHAGGDRLTGAAIVCGMGPAAAPGVEDGASWLLPAKLRLVRLVLLRLMKLGLDRDPERFVAQSMEVFSEPDRAMLAGPGAADAFVAGLSEAFRGGVGGADREATLYAHPWGFELGGIACPVWLWHGGQDANVPLSVGRFVAAAIPGCRATFIDDEGHLSLARRVLPDVLEALRGQAPAVSG